MFPGGFEMLQCNSNWISELALSVARWILVAIVVAIHLVFLDSLFCMYARKLAWTRRKGLIGEFADWSLAKMFPKVR